MHKQGAQYFVDIPSAPEQDKKGEHNSVVAGFVRALGKAAGLVLPVG